MRKYTLLLLLAISLLASDSTHAQKSQDHDNQIYQLQKENIDNQLQQFEKKLDDQKEIQTQNLANTQEYINGRIEDLHQHQNIFFAVISIVSAGVIAILSYAFNKRVVSIEKELEAKKREIDQCLKDVKDIKDKASQLLNEAEDKLIIIRSHQAEMNLLSLSGQIRVNISLKNL